MSLKIRSKDFGKNNTNVSKIAKIHLGDLDGKCLFLDHADDNGDQEVNLKGKSQFQPVPIIQKDQIERLFISGPSGSGKSFYLANWLKQWRKLKGNKDQEIYLFSSVDYDPVLDDQFESQLIRVLDEVEGDELLMNPLDLEDFEEGSVLIFDDVAKLKNIKTRLAVLMLLDSMLEIARHRNLTIIATSHILSNYKATRTLNSEATAVTVFPRKAGGLYGIKQYLDKKVGMSKDDMKRFLALSKKSRFVTLYRNLDPMIVISSKSAYVYDPFLD